MTKKLVIISGLSGSGKSTALHAFEDLGYYAIDNLPIKLFEKFAELIQGSGPGEFQKIALVMDLRDSAFVDHYPQVFRQVLRMFEQTEILFLESTNEALMRRFSETRRKHPLSNTDVSEGIYKERDLLSELKDLATTLIDTSAMDVHKLKRRIGEQYGAPELQQMRIRVLSFGFKYGIPKNCDLVLDVRFLTNPHFVPELRDLTGLDAPVAEFIERDERSREFLKRTVDFLHYLIPHYAQEGKSYLSVGIGCTGGKHRSVYIASQIAEQLQASLKETYPISVEHQDLKF